MRNFFTQIIQQNKFKVFLCVLKILITLNFILKVEEIYGALLITKIG